MGSEAHTPAVTRDPRGERAHTLRTQVLGLWSGIQRLKLVLGLVLLEIQEREYYREMGFETFESWLQSEAIPERSAYRYMALWRTYARETAIMAGPDGTPDDEGIATIAAIGVVKAELAAPAIAAAAAAGDRAAVAEILDDARELTAPDLRKRLAERGGAAAALTERQERLAAAAGHLRGLADKLVYSPAPLAVLAAVEGVVHRTRAQLAQERLS